MMVDSGNLSEILCLQSMVVVRMNIWSMEPGGGVHTSQAGSRDLPRSSHCSVLSGGQDWSATVFGDPIANSHGLDP